jgi:hypothetical protein
MAHVSTVFHAHTHDEIRLSQERRDLVINYLLEWLTGREINSKTLGHFRFIAEMFGVTAKVREMCKASSIQVRQELCVSLALAALNFAVSDEPVQPSERQIERREAKAAAKQFQAALAAEKPAGDEVADQAIQAAIDAQQTSRRVVSR